MFKVAKSFTKTIILIMLLLGLFIGFTNSNCFANIPYNDPNSDEKATDAENENNDGTDENPKDPCTCPGATKPGSLYQEIPFGRIVSNDYIGGGMFLINHATPSEIIASPQGLQYSFNLNSYILSVKVEASGTRYVKIRRPNGYDITYKFSNGTTEGNPEDAQSSFESKMVMLDSNKDIITNSSSATPIYYERILSSGSRIRFNASTKQTDCLISQAGHEIRADDKGVRIEVIKDGNGILQQVWSASDGLANITTVGITYSDEDGTFEYTGYQIKMYAPADVGTKVNGHYTFSGTPYQIWTVGRSSSVSNNGGAVPAMPLEYEISKITGGDYTPVFDEGAGVPQITSPGSDLNEIVFVWSYYNNKWTVDVTNYLRVSSKLELQLGEDLKVNKETFGSLISDHGGIISYNRYKESDYIKKFAWGGMTTERTIDPDGLSLKTETDYYTVSSETGKYTKVKSKKFPDGSWVVYDYDSNGRKFSEKRSLKNTAFNATPCKLIEYSYTSLDGADTVADNDSRPRTTSVKVDGTIVAKIYNVYKTVNGEYINITERAATPSAAYGTSGNLRMTKTYYADSAGDASKNRLKTLVYPDGKQDSWSYEYGNYSPGAQAPGTFTANAAGYVLRKTVIHGTTSSTAGVANKTTKDIIIIDERGNTVLKESYAYDGSNYNKVIWNVKVYDTEHHVTHTYKSNNTVKDTTWNCCNKESETTPEGTEYTYSSDGLSRIASKTKKGVSGTTVDIVTSYTYDCESNVLSESTTDGTDTLNTIKSYDDAQRLSTATAPDGMVTSYSYTKATASVGNIITVTYPVPPRNTGIVVVLPGGSEPEVLYTGNYTRIIEKYFDGRVKSISGTAVVAKYYDYGVDSGTGNEWTKESITSSASTRYTKTYTNALGKIAKIEKSGYNGSTITIQFYYNNSGQLSKKTQTALADTLYVYDSLGNLTRTGLDINENGTLDLASSDRISESATVFSQISSDWWLLTTKKTYATANSSTATTTSISKIRLTGLASGTISEIEATDIHGNETTATTTVSRATKTLTQTVNLADSSVDAQTITVNGLVASKRTSSNLTTTIAYDGLGRRASVTDPRAGQSTTAYYTSGYGKIGRVHTVTDAANNVTTYDYNTTTGRLAWVQNALGKKTYYDYNTLGQLTKQWGDSGYPIEKAYDSYGQNTTLKTYRAGSGWTGSTWPESSGTADTTTWAYDVSSGLVTAKTFADDNSVAYVYTNDGKLSTRTWARTSGGNPLLTTYAYDANTGEQTGIDYSDSTQDITFSYKRTGQQYQVTDSVGTRTFAYNAALQPTTETIAGGLYSKTLTNNYSSTGYLGRYTGMNISAEYVKALGYDTYGRQNTVSDGTDTFSYSFVANSDLVASVTRPHNLTTDYAYEANRNLTDYVENKYNTTSISKYDYTNDDIGRRTAKSRTGTAFATADSITFGYNDRSEVTSAVSNNIAAYNYGFTFDNIGNRGSSTIAGTTATYTANNLNQYTAITQGGTINPSYDTDGNMLTAGTANSTWNGENRLIEGYDDTTGKKLEFVYDYMGRRVEKKVYTGTSGTSWTLSTHEKFVYDGYKLIEVLDGQNSDAILQKFLWNGDEILSVYDAAATATYYYFADANKNIGQLMDSSGNTVAKYEYSPFGVQTLATGAYATTNPFRFSSEYYDSETGLVYYNYRYYSPTLGRWLSRDPIEEEGGYNLYGFIDNTPIDYWDELGNRGRRRARTMPRRVRYQYLTGMISRAISNANFRTRTHINGIRNTYIRRNLSSRLSEIMGRSYISSAGGSSSLLRAVQRDLLELRNLEQQARRNAISPWKFPLPSSFRRKLPSSVCRCLDNNLNPNSVNDSLTMSFLEGFATGYSGVPARSSLLQPPGVQIARTFGELTGTLVGRIF